MNEIRYFTKGLLIEYNQAAIREKRNVQIQKDVLKHLIEGDIFPVVLAYYHNKDEMRVMVSLFEAEKVLLDMTCERYLMLPIAKWNEKTKEYIFEDEQEIRKKFPYKNREWTDKVMKQPYRKQGKFRRDILKAYGHTCAVCGIKESKILRAAHIVPVAKGGTDEVQNGVCLCTNHEIAFDNDLLKIKPDGTIEILSDAFRDVYDTIQYPQNCAYHPSPKYLKMKYENNFDVEEIIK